MAATLSTAHFDYPPYPRSLIVPPARDVFARDPAAVGGYRRLPLPFELGRNSLIHDNPSVSEFTCCCSRVVDSHGSLACERYCELPVVVSLLTFRMADVLPKVASRFKSKVWMGIAGGAGLDGIFYVDSAMKRSRVEAMGGWSITRSDLGVMVQNYVAGRPPKPQVHEEPFMGFPLPADAVAHGVESLGENGDCEKFTFNVFSSLLSYQATMWVKRLPDDPSRALPVKLQQLTSTQTIELRLADVVPFGDDEPMPDELFDVAPYIPADRPPVVLVKGTVRNQATGTVHAGASLSANHRDNAPSEWTAVTGGQSTTDGTFTLKLAPNVCWTVRDSGAPSLGSHIFEVVPSADQPETMVADILLGQPGGMPAMGAGAAPVVVGMNPYAYGVAPGATVVSYGGMGMGIGGTTVVAGPGVVMYSTGPGMSVDQMRAAQMQQQAAIGMAAQTINAMSPLMAAVGGTRVTAGPVVYGGGVVGLGVVQQPVVYQQQQPQQQQQPAKQQPQPVPSQAPPATTTAQQPATAQPTPAPAAPPAAVRAPITTAPVVHEGLLSKYSMGRKAGSLGINFGSLFSGFRNWKNRFFRLHEDGILNYFESAATATNDKVIDTMRLSGARLFAKPTKAVHPEINPAGFDMAIIFSDAAVPPGAQQVSPMQKQFTLLLRAKSEEERGSWAAGFQRAGLLIADA